MKNKNDRISLKWGTLKSWHFESDVGKALCKEYCEIGYCSSAMMQNDTPRQKEIICQMIDLVSGEIYLEWDGKHVSKKDAKKYVMEYGK